MGVGAQQAHARASLPVIVIFCTVTSATYWKNGRAYSATLAYAVAILGSILVNALPDHRVGLLFSYWISSKVLLCRNA